MSDFVDDDPIVPDEAPAEIKRWALIREGAVETVTESTVQPETFGGPWVEAPDHVGPGWTWDGSAWAAPVPVTLPPHITVGAFKRRLGMDALSIANSQHPVCVALRELLYDQPYVDLSEGSALDTYLDMLIAVSQPDAHPMFPGSGPMTEEKKTVILTTPIEERERP